MAFNSFTYGKENSLEHGIYITGEAVYNAPARAVEMVSIPGRNGALAIDQGRFENIEVTYPAGSFGATHEEFADRVRAFRNILASQYTYARLTDTYHPDEYRMALYRDGLEVSPVAASKAGEFDITFDCKPQRYLLTGEVVKDVTNESGITNPTLFESKPLINVVGYGSFSIGSYTLQITGSTSYDIYIDCDTMEVYSITGGILISRSSLLNASEFPVLEPGVNGISHANTITLMTIKPRWWII